VRFERLCSRLRDIRPSGCPFRKSYPAVPMMQSQQDRGGDDPPLSKARSTNLVVGTFRKCASPKISTRSRPSREGSSSRCNHSTRRTIGGIPVLAQISTGLREAGDFHEPAVPLRSWWRFSLPLRRSSFSVFAAAPRSNSSLSLFSISWPFCADNAPVDLSFHPWIGFYGCCSTGSLPRSSTRWYWSSPQPSSRGIARASGSIGAGNHVARDGPGSARHP